MSSQTLHPIEDSVPKVGPIAVGENLDFQRKWWRFEHIVWSIFLVILVCDLLGLFGRGWLAKATRTTSDGAMTVRYERLERTSTPSVITLQFGSAAIANGNIQFFVSDSLVKGLGAERIAPEPALSTIGNGGILYTFAATKSPAMVQIQLEPSFPGMHQFRVQRIGSEPIQAKVFVFP